MLRADIKMDTRVIINRKDKKYEARQGMIGILKGIQHVKRVPRVKHLGICLGYVEFVDGSVGNYPFRHLHIPQ